MIVLGITGMELFLGQMASCTLAGGEDTKDPLTYKSNLDKAACLEQGGVWRANRFNFDNIGQAIITIFIISTGDNWQDIMYVAMDSTGDDTAPERDANKGAAAFFVFSILFAMMLWANLFVSALVDNFTKKVLPDLTIFFNLPHNLAKNRFPRNKNKDRFENLNDVFFNDVYNGYMKLVSENKKRIKSTKKRI